MHVSASLLSLHSMPVTGNVMESSPRRGFASFSQFLPGRRPDFTRRACKCQLKLAKACNRVL